MIVEDRMAGGQKSQRKRAAVSGTPRQIDSVASDGRIEDWLAPFVFPIQTEEGGISFQQWLEISPDALVVVDAAGQIVMVNRQVVPCLCTRRPLISIHWCRRWLWIWDARPIAIRFSL